MTSDKIPERQIRAKYSDTAITLYQAYGQHIAEPALAAQTFVAPFKLERMTWVKPSFLWMMYRSGWATKPGQERILGVDVSHEGFLWALRHSCLSHFDPTRHPSDDDWWRMKAAAPVRIQWDPERSITIQKRVYRSIQIGLSGEAVTKYLEEWIKAVRDVTDLAREIHDDVANGLHSEAELKLPCEVAYRLPDDIARIIGSDAPVST